MKSRLLTDCLLLYSGVNEIPELFELWPHLAPVIINSYTTLRVFDNDLLMNMTWEEYDKRGLSTTRNVSIGHGCPHRATVLSIFLLSQGK
jgi:hypothetical protein